MKISIDYYLLDYACKHFVVTLLPKELKRSRLVDWLSGRMYAIKRQWALISSRIANYIGTLAKTNRSENRWHVLPQSPIRLTMFFIAFPLYGFLSAANQFSQILRNCSFFFTIQLEVFCLTSLSNDMRSNFSNCACDFIEKKFDFSIPCGARSTKWC